MANKEPLKRAPKRPGRQTPLPASEPVVSVLERLAKNPSWVGELSAAQSSQLASAAQSEEEKVLVALFSKKSEDTPLDQERVTDILQQVDVVTPAIRKRISPRLAHHGLWEVLLGFATEIGTKKLAADLALVPSDVKSTFAATYLTSLHLSTDDNITRRQLKRDLAVIASWALNRDAEQIAKALLEFSLGSNSGTNSPMAKVALSAFLLQIPEEASIAAINASGASSLALSQLCKIIYSLKQGARHLQAFIILIAKSRQPDVLAHANCWNDLSLLEIGHLLKTPEIASHLSAQPAWWTARQRREIADEGVGAMLRFIDSHRSAGAVVDHTLLGTHLTDTKRAGNVVIREAFSAVVESALKDQATGHQLAIGKWEKSVRALEANIEEIKAEHAGTLKQLERLENDFRKQERQEIQSRKERDLAAQQPLLDSIVAIIIAIERTRQNTQRDERVVAFENEMETILLRESIKIVRDASDCVIEILRGETVLYRRK